MIDNIDSFVYNIVQYIGELGAEPIILKNTVKISEVEELKPEKIIISPGPRTPVDAGVSIEVVRKLGKEIPILGVCLGHQVIAHVFGGEISTAKRLIHGEASDIRHDGDLLFKGLGNPLRAARYHSLVVNRSGLPECFQIIAETCDEDKEIMGIKHVDLPIRGVQFHPESILTIGGKRLMKNFLEVI